MIKTITQLFLLAVVITSLAACSNYGKKVKHGHIEVYYKDGVSQELAQRTADYVYKVDVTENNNTTNTKSLQLLKKSDTIIFRMVADAKKIDDTNEDVFDILAANLSDSVFHGAPVNIELTNNRFKTTRSYTYRKTDTNFGPKVTVGNIEVYCKDNFNNEQATKLATFIKSVIDANNGDQSTKSFQVLDDSQTGLTVRMVSNPDRVNDVKDDTFNEMAKMLSDSVFAGKPVMLQLTDGAFKPFKNFPSSYNEQPKTDSTSNQ